MLSPINVCFIAIFFIERRNPFIPIKLNRLSGVMSTSKLRRRTLPCLTQFTHHGACSHENTALTHWQLFILFLVHILLYSKLANGCWSCWTEGQDIVLKSSNSTTNLVNRICNCWQTSFFSYRKIESPALLQLWKTLCWQDPSASNAWLYFVT